jgi:putative hydrolase of the HAD superfamily
VVGFFSMTPSSLPRYGASRIPRPIHNAYLSSLGIPEDKRAAALHDLDPVWSGPSPELWGRIVEGSIAGLQCLYDADLKLGVVSNSDGHAEEALVRNKICQVGSGEGVPVLTIVDSAVVGVEKPDPAIFDFAIPALGKDPSDVVYVGDSVKLDVRSARAAGMTPLHVDPYGLCQAMDHAHVGGVGEVITHV